MTLVILQLLVLLWLAQFLFFVYRENMANNLSLSERTLTPTGNNVRNNPDDRNFDPTTPDYIHSIDQIERELINDMQREMEPNNRQPANESDTILNLLNEIGYELERLNRQTYLKSVTNREE